MPPEDIQMLTMLENHFGEQKYLEEVVRKERSYHKKPTEINLALVHSRLGDGKGSIKRLTP